MTLYEMIDEVKADGIAIGREEGLLEGFQQKAYETARNLLYKGMTVDFVHDVIGLSIEVIQEIADEIN